jgi:Flp pilus assembly protein TadD
MLLSIFYNNRGLIYIHLYRNEEAIADYKKAIQLDSTCYVYYSNISIAYYYEKRIVDACQMFKLAKVYGLNMANHQSEEELMEIEKICN